MKLWLISFVLAISALWALLYPESLQKLGQYGGGLQVKKNIGAINLIRGWGIYAIALAIILGLNNIYDDDTENIDKNKFIVPGTVLSVFILSIMWDTKLYINKNLNYRYFVTVVILNLLGVSEISYYLKTNKTFINNV